MPCDPFSTQLLLTEQSRESKLPGVFSYKSPNTIKASWPQLNLIISQSPNLQILGVMVPTQEFGGIHHNSFYSNVCVCVCVCTGKFFILLRILLWLSIWDEQVKIYGGCDQGCREERAWAHLLHWAHWNSTIYRATIYENDLKTSKKDLLQLKI